MSKPIPDDLADRFVPYRMIDGAVEAGATSVREPEDQFYGDRASVVEDPFGHQWSIHTHLRDVTPEEMAQAMERMGGS